MPMSKPKTKAKASPASKLDAVTPGAKISKQEIIKRKYIDDILKFLRQSKRKLKFRQLR